MKQQLVAAELRCAVRRATGPELDPIDCTLLGSEFFATPEVVARLMDSY